MQRHVAAERAHILNMTLSEQWGRLFVSIGYALRTPSTPRSVAQLTVRAGVDLGVRTLATVATIDTTTGVETLAEYPNPAPLKATLTARRRAGRELSRRIPGSRGWNTAKTKLSRLDRRCVHLRREAAHQLTTQLAGAYGNVVIEDLDLAAMKQGMGRRAFRRAVSDAAMGAIGPQLAYKTARHGGVLTVAGRWFPSSQIHHGCHQPDGTPCRLIGKRRIDKQLVCPQTGEVVDRDHNAALNLRDWPDHASCGPVRATAPSVPGPTNQVGTGHGADAGSPGAGGAPVRPLRRGRQRRGQNQNPARGRRMSGSPKHTQRQRFGVTSAHICGTRVAGEGHGGGELDLRGAVLEAIAGEIRRLHRVVMAPGGVEVCDHCCLNRIGERRFSCLGRHDHRSRSAPCETLAILERFGL